MIELTVKADTDELERLLDIVEEQLNAFDCPMKVVLQVKIAFEEIFVNIAHYAFGEQEGYCHIKLDCDSNHVEIEFKDNGIAFDPLAKADPDITLKAEEREIGGLGIFMVKKSMDDVRYEYLDGYNVLTIKKNYFL